MRIPNYIKIFQRAKLSHFERVVTKHFVFLIDQYEFRIVESNDEHVEYCSDKVYFRIFRYWDRELSFFVGLLKHRDISFYNLPAFRILMEAGIEDYAERSNIIVDSKDVEKYVAEFAEIIKTHAHEALIGSEDFYERMAQKSKDILQQNMFDQRIRLAYKKLNINDYETVVELLSGFEKLMNSEQLEKYQNAKNMIREQGEKNKNE